MNNASIALSQDHTDKKKTAGSPLISESTKLHNASLMYAYYQLTKKNKQQITETLAK